MTAKRYIPNSQTLYGDGRAQNWATGHCPLQRCDCLPVLPCLVCSFCLVHPEHSRRIRTNSCSSDSCKSQIFAGVSDFRSPATPPDQVRGNCTIWIICLYLTLTNIDVPCRAHTKYCTGILLATMNRQSEVYSA